MHCEYKMMSPSILEHVFFGERPTVQAMRRGILLVRACKVGRSKALERGPCRNDILPFTSLQDFACETEERRKSSQTHHLLGSLRLFGLPNGRSLRCVEGLRRLLRYRLARHLRFLLSCRFRRRFRCRCRLGRRARRRLCYSSCGGCRFRIRRLRAGLSGGRTCYDRHFEFRPTVLEIGQRRMEVEM